MECARCAAAAAAEPTRRLTCPLLSNASGPPRRLAAQGGQGELRTAAFALASCLDRSCVPLGKGGARRKTSRRTTSFGPTDVFVGIICDRTRQKRSLVANGFD
jgi:hypothetical protein